MAYRSSQPAILLTPEAVAEFRQSKGWTQRELSNRAGIGLTTLNFIENGKTAIDRKTELAIYAVAAGLDVDPPALK